MPQVDQLAREAAGNPARREWLISQYSLFILSCAAKATGRNVSQSDDEWSIALSAFSEAIDCYDAQKGSFLSHARLVITRRLIDYERAQRRRREVPLPPEAFTGEEPGPIDYEVIAVESEAPDDTLREELETANEVLQAYGFSFFDLAGRTPKKNKPRGECAGAVNSLLDEPPLLSFMRARRRLPLQKLSDVSGARKKTLSFFRFFVITATEVLTRNLPSLARYFSFIRKEAFR